MEVVPIKERLSIFYLSCFNIGKIKFAPGTFGSLFGLLVYFINPYYRIEATLVLIAINFLISYFLIDKYNEKFGHDPSWIVQDEVIGMMLTTISPIIPDNFIWMFFSFALFRLFDIFKPFPINLIDKKVGAFYIIFDDILAGIFALITLQLLYFIYTMIPFLIIFQKFWIF